MSLKKKLKFGVHTIRRFFFPLLVVAVFLYETNFFSDDYAKIPQKLFDNLDIATNNVKKPDEINKDYNPMGSASYNYYNSKPEVLDTILKNLENQQNWQKVSEINKDDFDYILVQYCNKDITISVMLFDDPELYDDVILKVKSNYARRTYCYRTYKKSLKQ